MMMHFSCDPFCPKPKSDDYQNFQDSEEHKKAMSLGFTNFSMAGWKKKFFPWIKMLIFPTSPQKKNKKKNPQFLPPNQKNIRT